MSALNLQSGLITNEQGSPATDLIFIPNEGSPKRLEPVQTSLIEHANDGGLVVLLFADQTVIKTVYEVITLPDELANAHFERLLCIDEAPTRTDLLEVLISPDLAMSRCFVGLLVDFLRDMEPEALRGTSFYASHKYVLNGFQNEDEAKRQTFIEKFADHIAQVASELGEGIK